MKDYTDNKDDLPKLCLSTFVLHYMTGRNSKIKKRYGDHTKTISIFSPNLKSSRTSETYYKYCWFSLLKFKPWINYEENVFSTDIIYKDSCKNINILQKHITEENKDVTDEIKEKIIIAWTEYMNSEERQNDNLSDAINRQIDVLQQADMRIELIDNNNLNTQNDGYEVDNSQPDDMNIYTRINNNSREDDDTREIVWDKEYDFNGNIENLKDEEGNRKFIDEKWIEILGNLPPIVRRIITYDQCNIQQQQAVSVWLDICGVTKDIDGSFLPSKIMPNCSSNNVMIINGTAGTGKSYVIDCMIHELLSIPGNEDKTDLVMAPTGRVAAGVNGFTLQSAEGLRIPCMTGTQLYQLYF